MSEQLISPGTASDAVAEQKVSTHIIPAVLSTLFLNVLFGGAAIYFSWQVWARMGRGDYVGAKTASTRCLQMCGVALVLGILTFMVGFAS